METQLNIKQYAQVEPDMGPILTLEDIQKAQNQIPFEAIKDPTQPDIASSDQKVYELEKQIARLQEQGPTIVNVPTKDNESGFSKQFFWFAASIVVGLFLTKLIFKKG